MKAKVLRRGLGIWILVLLGGVAMAQNSKTTHAAGPAHSHKSHHGGIVKSAGDYHIEVVDRKNTAIVYLLDVQERTIPVKGVTGLAILRDGDRTLGTHPLTPGPNGYFNLPFNGHVPTAIIINFQVNNKNITAKFEKDGKHASNYFCPQKCAGSESNLAGACPKCGSALLDRRLLAKE